VVFLPPPVSFYYQMAATGIILYAKAVSKSKFWGMAWARKEKNGLLVVFSRGRPQNPVGFGIDSA
jgi:hypothetical protein